MGGRLRGVIAARAPLLQKKIRANLFGKALFTEKQNLNKFLQNY
jgi:hypothetical protein